MTLSSDERTTLYAAAAIRRKLNKVRNAAAAQERRERDKAIRAAHVISGAELAARQRQPRQHDRAYLAWLRRAPCVAGIVEGGCDGAVQAAHLRMNIAGRQGPGMQRKPDDQWCSPLCARHHIHDQHTGSEAAFWGRLGIDPFALCSALHAAFLDGAEPDVAVRHFTTRLARNPAGVQGETHE